MPYRAFLNRMFAKPADLLMSAAMLVGFACFAKRLDALSGFIPSHID